MIDQKALLILAEEIGLPLSPVEMDYYQERLTHFLPYIDIIENVEGAKD